MIAALYVIEDGPYVGVAGVDPWPESRDARTYPGPYPVIAHPPCERWGRYWFGGPSVKVRRKLGDDAGCFAAALASVRAHGGVLEHPEASHAFKQFGLPLPSQKGGWTAPDQFGGRSCCVAQGHYGHPAQKLTWLYAVGTDYPELTWGPFKGQRMDEGFHNAEERRKAREAGQKPVDRLSHRQRKLTPDSFKEMLLVLARSAREI